MDLIIGTFIGVFLAFIVLYLWEHLWDYFNGKAPEIEEEEDEYEDWKD